MRATLRFLVVLLVSMLLSSSPLSAADTTYQTVVKLKVPKNGKDKRVPKPLDEAPLAMWVPEGVGRIRGAVVNPFYVDTVKEKHWQEAVRSWGFALVGANFFGLKAEQTPETLQEGLKQLAKESGHPEVTNMPLCFVGMSIGAGLSSRLTEAMAHRTIATGPVCLEVGPRDAASRRVPMITVFGERDGRQMELLSSKLPQERKQGAQWAIAVQWGRKHEFARANNLLIPFFDRVILARVPESPLKDGTVLLAPYRESEGWLGNPATWKSTFPTIAAHGGYRGDRTSACWFPDAHVAAVWRAFVVHDTPLTIRAPKGLGDGAAFEVHPAGKKLTVEVAIKGDARFTSLELFDGKRQLGEMTGRPATLTVSLKPGIHPLLVIGTKADGTQVVSQPNTIVVGAGSGQ